MSGMRPQISTSVSFSGLPTTISSARPLKRRMTSTTDLSFFTPASASFEPKPFRANPVTSSKSAAPARANTIVPPPMDVSLEDPNATFIRPPFTTFPNSHLYPEGLTYSLLAENPEWFLVPSDFISETNDNPDAVLYPSALEPPKGWSPALKKELKERGVDTWPEGQEPRLRCTLCRRTYAGVNAKSMWRRHVYEKHKIAMPNRRENAERGRVNGRSSSKETKSRQDKKNSLDKENLTFVQAGTSAATRLTAATSTQSSPPKAGPSKLQRDLSSESPEPENAPVETDPPRTSGTTGGHLKLSVQPPSNLSAVNTSDLISTPPLTPHRSRNVGSTEISPASDRIELSPYNPLATPAFRHSPGPLPSDHPWRWDPSDPRHEAANELSLSMIVQEATRVSKQLESSPIAFDGKASGIFSSPDVFPKGYASFLRSSSVLGDSPSKPAVALSRPSPQRLFTMPESVKTMSPFRGLQSGLSPQFQDIFSGTPSLLGSAYELDWFPARDPILSYSDSHEADSPPVSSPETDSPVLRSSSALNVGAAGVGFGLGFGLLEPFSLDDGPLLGKGNDDDDIEELLQSPAEKSKYSDAKSASMESSTGTPHEHPETSRALKRRRTSA